MERIQRRRRDEQTRVCATTTPSSLRRELWEEKAAESNWRTGGLARPTRWWNGGADGRKADTADGSQEVIGGSGGIGFVPCARECVVGGGRDAMMSHERNEWGRRHTTDLSWLSHSPLFSLCEG